MNADTVMFPALETLAPGIGSLQPYIPGKPIEELQRELGLREVIKLASNENPLGPSPRAVERMRECLSEVYRYPDGSGFRLRAALAARHGVTAAQITLGNGSNDVLDLVARVFLYPGVEAVFSRYAFAVYPIATQAVGARARVVDASIDYGHDLEAMSQAVTDHTRVVFIANPNNPTGGYLSSAALQTFMQHVPPRVMVVVDEAYAEYVVAPDYPDATAWITEYPNLMVTRTFSKAFGLAGLRVGYAVSHSRVADLLNRVRQPFNTSLLAQEAALAALGDLDHLQRSVLHNCQGLRWLSERMSEWGLPVIASVGNFLTIEVGDAMAINERLLACGCIVRPIGNYGMPRHLRVSIGTASELEQFVRDLRQCLA